MSRGAIYFDKRKLICWNEELERHCEQLMRVYPDKFDTISQLIRSAVMRVYRELILEKIEDLPHLEEVRVPDIQTILKVKMEEKENVEKQRLY